MLLALVWGLLSGHYSLDWLIFVFGVASCLFVAALTLRLRRQTDALTREDPVQLAAFWRLPRYLLFLIWQVVLSNLHVARRILAPRPRLHSQLVCVRASQRTTWGQVLHANSITLTPGTVTLDVSKGEFLVHALTDEAAEGVREGSIDRAAARLEGTP